VLAPSGPLPEEGAGGGGDYEDIIPMTTNTMNRRAARLRATGP